MILLYLSSALKHQYTQFLEWYLTNYEHHILNLLIKGMILEIFKSIHFSQSKPSCPSLLDTRGAKEILVHICVLICNYIYRLNCSSQQ